MLKLPPVAQCLSLRDDISELLTPQGGSCINPFVPPLDPSYEHLVEEQPIGCRLFFLFCQRDLELSKCVGLIKSLEEYVLVPEEKALSSAHKLFQEFLEPEVVYESTIAICVCVHPPHPPWPP